jgi:outer membrane protein insertion porin family
VLSYLPVEVGDDYDAQTSSKIIRVLYKTQFFKDIEVTEEEQILMEAEKASEVLNKPK